MNITFSSNFYEIIVCLVDIMNAIILGLGIYAACRSNITLRSIKFLNVIFILLAITFIYSKIIIISGGHYPAIRYTYPDGKFEEQVNLNLGFPVLSVLLYTYLKIYLSDVKRYLNLHQTNAS